MSMLNVQIYIKKIRHLLSGVIFRFLLYIVIYFTKFVFKTIFCLCNTLPYGFQFYIYIYIYIFAIMKTMCPPGYHHNGFVATHALGHMMYSYYRTSYAQVHELPQSHCGDNWEGTLFL